MNASISPRFQWRAFTSVLLAIAFLLLALSGTVLFVSPPGRVANWTNWTLLGLRKSDWSGLHVWFSATFLAMTLLHLMFNWRPLLSYFKNRVSRRVGTRTEWAVAAVVCGVVFAGTRAGIAPFSSLLAWNERVKESWEQPAERAPIPHAELLTVATLAEKAGVDPETAIARLRAKGVTKVAADAVVRSVATDARNSAQQLYDIVRADPKSPAAHSEAPGGGTGWKTLRQYCADERIDFESARTRLLAKGISLDESATLRDLAARAGQKPYELVALIKAQP